MKRFLSLSLFTAAASLGLVAAQQASAEQALPKALVYCPSEGDTECGRVAGALSGSYEVVKARAGSAGAGWVDPTSSTVTSLSGYKVVVVPGLADIKSSNNFILPYKMLRSNAAADLAAQSKLSAILTGRVVGYHGTPDFGSENKAQKDAVILKLATWAGAGSGTGLVVLLDNSGSVSGAYGAATVNRFDWVSRISGVTLSQAAQNPQSDAGEVTLLSSPKFGSDILGGFVQYNGMVAGGFVDPTGANAAALSPSVDALGKSSTRVLVSFRQGSKAPTGISAVSGSGTYASVATLTATLTSNGSGVSNKKVIFTLNGVAVCDTDANTTLVDCPSTSGLGVATLSNVSLATSVSAITHSNYVGASFAGDDTHQSSGTPTPGNLVVSKASTTTEVTCGAGPFTYTGSAQTPCSATVMGAGGLSLTPAPVYANNINAGTATASYTYAESTNHLGSSDSETFTIGQVTTTTTVTCPAGPFTYNGAAQTPCSATVTGAGGLNQSLEVSYGNNINAGSATASASYAGSTNYEISSDSKTFTIGQATATISVTGFSGPYDGTERGATGTATGVGGANLNSLLNLGAKFIDAPGGTATWTFSDPAGNYKDVSNSVQIAISKVASSTVVTCPATSLTYTGDAQTPCTVAVTGVNLNQSPAPVYANNINAGTATASYTYAESTNHLGSSDSEAFTIGKAPTTTTVTFAQTAPYIYSGSTFTATARATGAGGLDEPVTVIYSGDCTNVTSANGCTATATYTESANHRDSGDSKSITIAKADQTISFDALSGKTFGDAAFGVSAMASSGLPVSFAASGNCTVSNTTVTITGAGSCTITASQTGNTNYNGATAVSQSFAIVKAGATITFTELVKSITANPLQPSYTVSFNGQTITVPVSFTYSPSLSPTNAGVYNVTATINDPNYQGTAPGIFVVYDPSAGFVTGGGWIKYDNRACPVLCSGVAGKADFGFVSKYQKGANTPTGDTRFEFHAGTLKFVSSSYEWLVVSGGRAQFKGVGKINGQGNYGFILTAVDGATDSFRIKIVDRDNGDTVVFDNQIQDDSGNTLTALDKVNGNGSIVIHSK